MLEEIITLLTEHRDLVVESLRRESELRQRIGMTGAAEEDTDPLEIKRVLAEANTLSRLAAAVEKGVERPASDAPSTAAASEDPPPKTERLIAMNAPSGKDVVPSSGQRNVLQEILAAEQGAPANQPPKQERSAEKRYALSADAINGLLGDDEEPIAEDGATPSPGNSVAHQDTFSEPQNVWPNVQQPG